jgi:hypothetical protein
VDLKGSDKILIRDGDMVYDTVLANFTSDPASVLPYVLTTGRSLYITMQTSGVNTGRGFRFTYYQGDAFNQFWFAIIFIHVGLYDDEVMSQALVSRGVSRVVSRGVLCNLSTYTLWGTRLTKSAAR